MRKFLIFAVIASALSAHSCSKSSPACSFEGRHLYKGPKGGCYYLTENKSKVYVDRSACNCN